EILGRMALPIPVTEVQHEVAARGPRSVDVRILARGLAEHSPPILAAAQTVSIVDRVPGFMTQNAHQPTRIAALHFTHHLALEPHQARMRHVERNRDARHSIRRKPFVRYPNVRFETNTPTLQLALQPCKVA